MVVNIVNLLSRAFSANSLQASTAVSPISNNPFAKPITAASQRNYTIYAKNNPVQGGYFAGYYNGKANIVGQRLFVEA